MASLATFHRLLDVQEQRKLEVQQEYQTAQEQFEDVATQLYTLLKKKEQAEARYEQTLQTGLSITTIQETVDYISRLEGQIASLQGSVQQARQHMNDQHVALQEAHVDTKKYEKLIQNKVEKQRQSELYYEKQQMDEISVQQFLSQS
ncbi:hypothetical protein N781_12210 [Pontibacillus halophilus JSM 076056 = DSM 19796]|uniref:Flagellar FliJ protein n=1 Tax=Pontibacillus halophilus JSM 076056 = DSM 19796 TaxID=1385510 RepID=A0A0A5GQ04_9BACI|nr:flagellar export protein FliJ [Pontibacillus halophilus]KGX93328.1 hypothetical protein N781_12210 [Pontibacillus halophilus JSM 076056 = DSM 19796]